MPWTLSELGIVRAVNTALCVSLQPWTIMEQEPIGFTPCKPLLVYLFESNHSFYFSICRLHNLIFVQILKVTPSQCRFSFYSPYLSCCCSTLKMFAVSSSMGVIFVNLSGLFGDAASSGCCVWKVHWYKIIYDSFSWCWISVVLHCKSLQTLRGDFSTAPGS